MSLLRIRFGAAPAVSAVWGAVGDSQTDEYRADDDRADGSAYEAFVRNWLELLVDERGLNCGAWGTRSEPRRTGYEYNWARSGSTMATVVSGGQVTGLAAQITAGTVSHAITFATGNEWANSNFSPTIISDVYNQAAGNQARVDGVRDIIIDVMDDLVAAGVQGLVVVVPFDYAKHPGIFAAYPDATRRGYVSTAIAGLRSAVVAHAASLNTAAGYTRVVVVNPDEYIEPDVYATADGTYFTAAGMQLNYASAAPNGEPGYYALAAVGGGAQHMGTVGCGLVANAFIAGANQLPGISLTPFSDAEIRANAGA